MTSVGQSRAKQEHPGRSLTSFISFSKTNKMATKSFLVWRSGYFHWQGPVVVAHKCWDPYLVIDIPKRFSFSPDSSFVSYYTKSLSSYWLFDIDFLVTLPRLLHRLFLVTFYRVLFLSINENFQNNELQHLDYLKKFAGLPFLEKHFHRPRK